MFGIGIAADHLHVTADARCRGVPGFILHRRTVNLLQHRIVNISTEGVLHRIKIWYAELKKLAAHPKEARHAPTVLAEYGIRFLIVGSRVNDELG